MTPLEAEALLVRYQAAVTHIERTDEQGRWALLDEVVYPGELVEAASLQAAAERGVSRLALAMVATANQQRLEDDRDLVAAAQAVPVAA